MNNYHQLLILYFLVLFSSNLFGQDNTVISYGMHSSKFIEILNNTDLNAPYLVTTNHTNYKNELMCMLVEKNESEILSIIKTKGFYSFIVTKDNCIGHPKTDSDILLALSNFRQNLPENIPYTASIINEDNYLGDSCRSENWLFNNTKGASSKMTVLFINNQITNILISL